MVSGTLSDRPEKIWVRYGSINCRIPYYTVLQGAELSKTNQQDSILVIVAGTKDQTFLTPLGTRTRQHFVNKIRPLGIDFGITEVPESKAGKGF